MEMGEKSGGFVEWSPCKLPVLRILFILIRDTRYFNLEYTNNIWIKDTSGDFGFGPLKIRDLVSPLRKQWSQEFKVNTFNSSALLSFTVL